MTKRIEAFPEESAADVVHAIGRAAFGAVPVLGAPAQVLFEAVFAQPAGRRKDEWMRTLADVVQELGRRIDGLTAEALAANDIFITAAAQASQVALRTHQQEKLDALRNAVLHSGLPNAPDEDLQQMFLHFIDELTPWHLRLLALFRNPGVWLQSRGIVVPNWDAGGVGQVIELAFPELRGRQGFYRQVLRDLGVRGLMHRNEILGLTMSLQGMLTPRIENFGIEFLNFIDGN